MIYHILNGDALAEKFPGDVLPGEIIVLREAFISGPVSIQYDRRYWENREEYIARTYGNGEGYRERMMSSFGRLQKIHNEDQVYLWFEDDLFCQCNMWFSIDYISQKSKPQIFRIFPVVDRAKWTGFGFDEKEQLVSHFNQAKKLSQEDIAHIRKLWAAFVNRQMAELKSLAQQDCGAIRFQDQVIQAELDRRPDESGNGRPQRTLSSILNEGTGTFYEIFEKFSAREGIYGFGDSQVKIMLDEMNQTISY